MSDIAEVKDLPPRVQYVASGGQTVFIYPFPIFDEGDLVVEQNGTELTLDTDYTVSGVAAEDGGSVTFTSGATAGDVITIYRDMAFERLIDYQQNGDFLAQNVNRDFDRLWLAIQQVNGGSSGGSSIARAYRASPSDPVLSDEDLIIPDVSERAGRLVGFDGSGEFTYIVPNISIFDGKQYDNLALLKMDTTVQVGQFVRIHGRFAAGDGGDNDYEIVAAGTGTDDGGSFIDLSGSGLQARGLFPSGEATIRQFGAVGDGITSDRDAFLAAESTSFTAIDLLGLNYNAGINTNTEKGSLTKKYFNGTYFGPNSIEAETLIQTKTSTKDYEIERPRTKTPELAWEGKRILWLGTSIPHQGVGTDSYPELFAETLGCSVRNLAWSGSHAFYDVNGDPFAINTVTALSMTEDDRLAGLALHGPTSAYDDSFDPVTKASQMTADFRIAQRFSQGAFDVAVLDHAHNDRLRGEGELSPSPVPISDITKGGTTIISHSGSQIPIGSSVYIEVEGIASLHYAAARVQASTAGSITLNINSDAYNGVFESGNIFVVDKNTIYGAWNFLIAYIKNQSIVKGTGSVKIILAGAPSQHTNDVDIDFAIWSIGERIKNIAGKWGLSFFDIGFVYDVKKHDQLTFFPDGVHPTTFETRAAIASQWTAWASGGEGPPVNRNIFLEKARTAEVDQREPLYSKYDQKYGIRSQIIEPGATIIDDDFSGGLGAWTLEGNAPTVVAAPWGGGGSAVLCQSTVVEPISRIVQAVALGDHPAAEFDLWLPEDTGLTPGPLTATIPICELRPAGTAYTMQLLVKPDAISTRVQYFKSPNSDLTTPQQIFANLIKDTRYRLSIDVVKSDGNNSGFLLFILDGEVLCAQPIDNANQVTLTTVRLGAISSNTGQDLDLYLGDVLVQSKLSHDYTQRFTGSFVAQSGETVTVVNGVIVSAS